jgi:putative oxidoreductase
MSANRVMDDDAPRGRGSLRAVQTATPRPRPHGHVREASRWVQLRRRLGAYDRTVRRLLGRASPMLLRISLGVVFVWFGALKVAGVSAVGGLVAATVPFLDSAWLVLVLGVVEIAIGLAFATGRLLRVVLPVFAAHMAGTFLVLITLPDVAFQGGNPVVLTAVGEFVVKNLVLLTAGLAVASGVRPLRPVSVDRRRASTDQTRRGGKT